MSQSSFTSCKILSVHYNAYPEWLEWIFWKSKKLIFFWCIAERVQKMVTRDADMCFGIWFNKRHQITIGCKRYILWCGLAEERAWGKFCWVAVVCCTTWIFLNIKWKKKFLLKHLVLRPIPIPIHWFRIRFRIN